MNPANTTFNDRLKAAADSKKAMMAKFKPKPMVAAPEGVDPVAERKAAREAELERVRAERVAAKVAAREAQLEAEAAVQQTEAEKEASELDAKRSERKARKAQAKEEARMKRETRRR